MVNAELRVGTFWETLLSFKERSRNACRQRLSNALYSILSANGVYFTQLRGNLLARGFAVGSIDYRFPPLYTILDQVVDAKCA